MATEMKDNGANKRTVALVGTYKEKQLDWICEHGVYNYPVKDEDDLKPESCGRVRELWLYAGAKAERHCFAAEFVGIQSRDEFLAANPSYAKLGKGRHSRYMVFKVKALPYGPALDDPLVVARVCDFAKRTPKIAKAIKEFQAGGDFASLADSLPTELSALSKEQLCVCEEAVQLDFFEMIYPQRHFPAMASLDYVQGEIKFDQAPSTNFGLPFRMGEFFCGPGGLACGALSARIENEDFRVVHAWANDYDLQTCETYRENICHDAPETVICGDVRKLDLNDSRLTPIDGFAFGFPCNDFSVVGGDNSAKAA